MAANNNIHDFMVGVADAIRAKKGSSELINPQDFAAEIAGIQGGGGGGEQEVYQWTRKEGAPDLTAMAASLGTNGLLLTLTKDDTTHTKLLGFHFQMNAGGSASATLYGYKSADGSLTSLETKTFSNSSSNSASPVQGYYRTFNFAEDYTDYDYLVVKATNTKVITKAFFRAWTTEGEQLRQSDCPCYEAYFKGISDFNGLPEPVERITFDACMMNTQQLCFNLARLHQVDFQNGSRILNMYRCFYGCTSLRRVVGMTITETTSLDSTFAYCALLETIDGIEEWNGAKLTSIATMLQECRSLRHTDLDLREWGCTSSLNTLNNAFNGSNVTKIDIRGWNLSGVKNTSGMCNTCRHLKEFISDSPLSVVTNISNAFANCSSLIRCQFVVTSSSLTSANTLEGLCNGCSSLQGFDFSGWSIPKAQGMTNWFNNCRSLKGTIAVPACAIIAASTITANVTDATLDLSQVNLTGVSSGNMGNIFNTLCADIIFPPSNKMPLVSWSFQSATHASHTTLLRLLNALPSTSSSLKLTLGSAMLSMLTDAEKAIATGKGWTLA